MADYVKRYAPTANRRVVRVSDFQPPSPADGEKDLLKIDSPDWCSSLDVAVSYTGVTNSTFGNDLVRVYAINGSTRTLVGRGRTPLNAEFGKRRDPAVRVRAQPAEAFVVSYQSEIGNSFTPVGAPVFPQLVVSLFGDAGSGDARPPTQYRRVSSSVFPGIQFGFQASGIPAELYSLASLNSDPANDAWLMVFDTANISSVVDGTPPIFPALYVPAAGKGTASFSFGDRPWRLYNGLAVKASTTDQTLTTGASGLDLAIEYT